MKFQHVDLLCGNNKQTLSKTTILLCLTILTFTLITLLSYSLSSYHSMLKINKYNKQPPFASDDLNGTKNLSSTSSSVKKCDIFNGEWVPNLEAPYYTNTTCLEIHEHQNCMKYGRPDTEFMKWRWKPHECELPLFNPFQFLEIMRGKSMAFVGDSLGRHHMQSMNCLLSRVELPIDVSYTNDPFFRRWKYSSYNFTVAIFWAPYLVRATKSDSNSVFTNLYLDEFDEKWTTQIKDFDYVIINGGRWFLGPMIFYEKQKVVGCQYCYNFENVTQSNSHYGYRKAFRTAFKAIISLENFKGVTFLRTFSPAHYENGLWNKGGNCVRTKPFKGNETKLESEDLELYEIQLEEFQMAKKEAIKKGLKFMLLDTTPAMLLRPDGHPKLYGIWTNENKTRYNDCVHWCLPGPIDSWSDFLLEMLKMDL